MGWFDYVSDVYASLSIQSAAADIQEDMHSASGDFNSSKDQQGGMGTAQQSRGATTKGGVSDKLPHAGTDEESPEEAEANKQDAKSPEPSGEKGHTPGDEAGKAAAGQVGADKAGPHGGAVGPQKDEDEDEEESGGDDEDEEEEEEDEPEDPMPKIHAGESDDRS